MLQALGGGCGFGPRSHPSSSASPTPSWFAHSQGLRLENQPKAALSPASGEPTEDSTFSRTLPLSIDTQQPSPRLRAVPGSSGSANSAAQTSQVKAHPREHGRPGGGRGISPFLLRLPRVASSPPRLRDVCDASSKDVPLSWTPVLPP